PIADEREGFFSVLTPCEIRGWIASADVDVHPRAAGDPRSLRDPTIVIDPGHGGGLTGAVGPSGLAEKEPNADIARRLASRLEGSRVFLTLSGDFDAGLEYRAAIADALRSHVFLSIHNNAEPDGTSERPGTETYYQHGSPSSKRLAGLLYEEVVRAVEPFGAAWVADSDAGAKYRLNDERIDYYGLLRRAEVPTVLVEVLFVSNGPEEALLGRPDVREAVAAALASGLKRFFETADPGSGFVEPYAREPGPSGRLPAGCTDPGP
ncbi:MAG: N-acetylmuramoyl-L-alanine amidase family protein, partial [Actinomycetota bacterium]